jgi:hypothetical protein
MSPDVECEVVPSRSKGGNADEAARAGHTRGVEAGIRTCHPDGDAGQRQVAAVDDDGFDGAAVHLRGGRKGQGGKQQGTREKARQDRRAARVATSGFDISFSRAVSPVFAAGRGLKQTERSICFAATPYADRSRGGVSNGREKC